MIEKVFREVLLFICVFFLQNATFDATVTNNTEALGTRLSRDWKINEHFSIVIVSLFVPTILCTNVMVVVSVLKFKRLQIPTNYFIVSLAVADILVAIALPFYVTVELTPVKVTTSALCLTANRTLMTAGGVSILTLSVIAYDRYTAVVRPLGYIMFMTKRKICCFVVVSWIYSIAVSWLPVICGWHGDITDHRQMCSNTVLHSRTRIIFIAAIFMPACACILFCYFRIFKIARHHAHAIAAMENSLRDSIERQFVQSDTKYAKTLAIVIGVFLSLWLPYQICLFLEFVKSSFVNYWVKNYLMLLAFSNSAVNPWVYAYKNLDFRSAFKKIFESWKCRGLVSRADRRTSTVSISVLSAREVSGRLDRANSRVLASDILYTLSQLLGRENVNRALNRHLSSEHDISNLVGSLPVLLRMEVSSGDSEPSTSNTHDLTSVQAFRDKQQDKLENRDSAYSNTDFVSETTV